MAPDPASLENTANGSNAMDGSETAEQRENRELRARVQQLEGLVQTMALQQKEPIQSRPLQAAHTLPQFTHAVAHDQSYDQRFSRDMAPPPMHQQSSTPRYRTQAQYAPVRYEYVEQQHPVRYVDDEGHSLGFQFSHAQSFPAASEKEPPRVKQEMLPDPVNVKDKPKPEGERTHDLNSKAHRRTKTDRTAPTKQLPSTSNDSVPPIQTRSPFLQDPETLNGSAGNLWTIPSPLHWGNHSLLTCTEPVEKKFLEAREKIERKWQSGVKSALPLALYKSTPYSLSLVVKLGEFADNANSATETLDLAHGVLTQQWKERVSKLPQGGRLFVTTVKSETDPERSGVLSVEGNVLENVYGLMLEDVERAMQITTSRATEIASHAAVTASGPFFSTPYRSINSAKLLRKGLNSKRRKQLREANERLSSEAVFRMKNLVIQIRDRRRMKLGLTELERKAAKQEDKIALAKIKMAEKKRGEKVKKAQERQEREAFDMLVDKEKARKREASKKAQSVSEEQAKLEGIKTAEANQESMEAKKKAVGSGQIKGVDWKQVIRSKIVEVAGIHSKFK
ncbi:hypothetical protein LTR97_012100 [Elasticomyces elasticus]|uniref:Uncharacterized protein n=1 Tax=Elasticomyces elasticus TaxID=574655 RepID=A0AAN7ZY82_9PEZI|nr:hypothetical protein LTR97_012100 [Elasticomyces elasticus]